MNDTRLLQFQRALAQLQREVERDLGASDLAHLDSLRTLSRRLELLGRALLHFSFEPLGFAVGVTSLWAHKCIERMEVGHAEASETAVAAHPEAAPSLWPTTTHAWDWATIVASTKAQVTDTVRLFQTHASGQKRADRDRPAALHHRAHETALGYLAKAVLLVPPLTRPFFWKVAVGTLIAELARDALQLAMIRVGRIDMPGEAERLRAARAPCKHIDSARDVELPYALSILCGALDKRVEHHLFPHLPPRRLRQLAPRVKALCAEHGVAHQNVSLLEAVRILLSQQTWRAAVPAAPRAQLLASPLDAAGV